MTTTDAGLLPLVLQLGRARAAAMDVPAVLTSVCSAMPSVLGVGGAVLLVVEPPNGIRALTASDARALWFGEAQQRADLGPLPGAVRTWRPMLTADLTRIGPPAVAAAAAECGLTSSLVLPFDVDGDRLGVLQLLGEAARPVEAAHAEVLRPLLDALAARLADVWALHRAGSSSPASHKPTPQTTAPPARVDDPASPCRLTGDFVVSPLGAQVGPGSATPQRAGTPSARTSSVDGDRGPSGSADRRSRRGAHATPESADPVEATEASTLALPTVSGPRSATRPVLPTAPGGWHSA